MLSSGMACRNAATTVRPPIPESKTPMGAFGLMPRAMTQEPVRGKPFGEQSRRGPPIVAGLVDDLHKTEEKRCE